MKVKTIPRPMASNEPIPNKMVMVEPKAKEYKTKKEKEKYVVVEKLITLRQTMVGEELCDEEVQSIRNMGKLQKPLHTKIRKRQSKPKHS